jgi:hypothetical protein
MARIDSLSILSTSGGYDDLAERYGQVIANVQAGTISSAIKNMDLSGDPTTGTVEAKRFVNIESNAYGTARSGRAGQKGTAQPVVVAINSDRELIEEVEDKDVRFYGVDNYINRKLAMHESSMIRELERTFFRVACESGTVVTLTGSTALDKFEEMVQKCTGLQNDYIDGVPREMVTVITSEAIFGTLRNYMNTNVQNTNVDSSVKELGTINGAKIASSVYLPMGADWLVMIDGAVAQPVTTTLDEAGKIPLSNAYHFGLFYSYGTKAVMPDAIFMANGSDLSNIAVTSAVNSGTATSTDITVSPATAQYGGTLTYKLVGSDTNVKYLETLAGTSALTLTAGAATIASATNKFIIVAEVDGAGRVLAANCVKAITTNNT